MDKKDGIILIIGAGFETIGWGVGMIEHIPPQVSYTIVALGFAMILYAGFRFIRYKPTYPTWQELQARGAAKRQYLDPLKETIKELIKQYKNCMKQAIAFSLHDYNKKYFRRSSAKKDILANLIMSKFFLNNRYYKELKQSIYQANASKYEDLHSHIKDKKLKRQLKQLWKCEHQANSVEIFYEIARMNFDDTPERVKLIYEQQENARQEYQQRLDGVSARIDELLGGVPDEQ